MKKGNVGRPKTYKQDGMTFTKYKGVELLKDDMSGNWTISSHPGLFGNTVYYGGYDKLKKIRKAIDTKGKAIPSINKK